MAIELLLNLRGLRMLHPFLRGEHSLGSAAAAIGVPPSSLAYWVARFRRAGLVEVVRTQRRAGKPIPVYRATADAFAIPFDALPPGAKDDLLHGARRMMMTKFSDATDRYAERYAPAVVRVGSDGITADEAHVRSGVPSPVTEFWGQVALTEDEAIRLRARIDSVVAEFRAVEADAGGKPYIVMMGFTPQ